LNVTDIFLEYSIEYAKKMLEYSLIDGHKPYQKDMTEGRMCQSVKCLDNPGCRHTYINLYIEIYVFIYIGFHNIIDYHSRNTKQPLIVLNISRALYIYIYIESILFPK
jgi:hypothetical protein